ncbi:solute carrier family 28 member 3 [Drosophila guanche]|uniref:Blast:Sodium/nucleoside cotransporter 2 n=1 Tax=Drosophila guanche TaxID=7266 RepID=A0A3B0JGG2_DROGU|nr:solute carrier family 28 member 3 [Drosophila guanche]SPP74440.1 blast:Sodium/nucleoside cotransporter 2 [Drosophila guanche]
MEPLDPEEEPSKKRALPKLLLHIFFHILLISYFIAATVVYITYDSNTRKCISPSSSDEPESSNNTANATDSDGDKEDETKFKAFILCKMNWCHGYGFLICFFVTFYILWLYYWVFKPFIGQKLYDEKIDPALDKWIEFSRQKVISLITLLIVIVLAVAYLIFECRDDMNKLMGLAGPVVFLLIGFAASKHHKAIPWRIVTHGILGQLLMGILCLRLAFGRDFFDCAGEKVTVFLNFAGHGARFVYGDRICDEFVFAFAILAVIFFFSVVTSCLYYLGVMQFILGAFGFLLQSMVGTTVCESVNAAGNVFLGMSESPLLIRPYIDILTMSELHTICTSGYATVAGTVLGAYISFGASPAYLITASVMAAPASLAFSKLFYPETEESQTRSENIQLEKSPDTSILDAAISGSAAALMIVLGIVSNIIAFLAMVYFFSAVIEWSLEMLGQEEITLLYLLSKLFIPLVFVMGVPSYDCERIGLVVAEKTFINEFVAYKHLGELIKGKKVDSRSAGIATFALCGFANPGSLGILIAALSAMAPSRRSDITQVAVRAFFAGSFVSYTSASLAGILIQERDLHTISNRFSRYVETHMSDDDIQHQMLTV